MELVLTDWTFGTEELSAYSRFARKGETTPKLFLHPNDAQRLGLAAEDRVALHLDGGELALQLGIASNMASGVIILPRHRQVKWQKLKQWSTMVPDDHIRKV
jgi:NADH-quinone oxidoreductase subunit G